MKDKVIIILLVSLLFSGCVKTYVEPNKLGTEVFKLASVNKKTVGIKVLNYNTDNLGYQFLLIILPFGNIKVKDLDKHILAAAYKELSILGYQPVLSDYDKQSTPYQLKISINNVNLNAYDYFFTRKIKAKINLSAGLFDQNNNLLKQVNLEATESDYERYAFKSELEQIFTKACEKVAKKMLDRLFTVAGA